MHCKIGIYRADENEGVSCGKPGKNRCKGGIIDGGHEPADHIGVFSADGCFGIVNNAVDLFIFLSHYREGKDAENHDYAADDPGKDSERHIAVGFFKNGLRFKENAASYDYSDYHTDSRQ